MTGDAAAAAEMAAAAAAEEASENSKRFGVPGVEAETVPEVAAESRRVPTAAGVRSGERDNRAAAAPATCGADMDVPLMAEKAVADVIPADVIPTPGA